MSRVSNVWNCFYFYEFIYGQSFADDLLFLMSLKNFQGKNFFVQLSLLLTDKATEMFQKGLQKQFLRHL